MELITLAHIKLNRLGSAGRSGFGLGNRQEHKFLTEVVDADVETLRQVVIKLAEANGESPGILHDLWQERSVGHPAGQVLFNIQGPSTHYSSLYAECQVTPALKIGSRYFKLEEFETKGSIVLLSSTEAG
ncbi:hypothetical protein [Pseudomonas sp.]|uniref:hypothetical protein n=1 Tax=Pseudomonas sp. TaxID=306 RepID=UPI003FD76EFB